MSGQKFYADPNNTFRWPNGAIGYRPGGPFDCLGPYAKVENCPIEGTMLRRTCYATGYPDTAFSIPAVCTIDGQRIVGFFTGTPEEGVKFCVMNRYKARISKRFAAAEAQKTIEFGI